MSKSAEKVLLVSEEVKGYGSFLPHLQFGRATAKVAQTLHGTDSMVSLCFRSLAGFINDDNLQGLQSFLESKQVQVDDRDENATTALMVAACKGRTSFVRDLLAHGADPNAEDADAWSAIICAAKEGHKDVCCELLEHGAEIDHRDMGGWTGLMWATYKGRVDVVNVLLERGADVNAHGNYHLSSLLWAAGRGHTEIVRALISHGAKVNVGDKYGTTAVVWACRKGFTEIVELLLRAGANVDTAGMYSWTALLVATQANNIDVINLLLEHKPNVNALDKDGCSALMISCKEGFYEISTALMNTGAYINVQDRAGDTNLIHAVKGGHRGVVEALLKKYADVDVCGKDRKTAVYVAVEKGNISLVKLLLSANPDLEISTKDGDTPLLKAVRSRNAEIVQLLLDKKSKVSAADKKGDTALHIAMRARSKGIVEILLRNPKHSQLLYRPNRAGETPYNIDINHQKTILGQIFGARRLNTNEDNENMLGYDLYSSALADILSEPSLSMPITVGLYAKWGSGKSFLLNKLREEMKNFAREWVDPVFQFTALLFIILLHFSLLVATVVGLSFQNWIIGLSTGVVAMFLSYIFLTLMWFTSKRYDWDWPYNFNVNLTRKMNNIKLILQIMFCHPPGAPHHDAVSAQPIRFYFTDQTRVSSTTGGENSVVQMIGSLYDALENDSGAIATRLYRAFKPKPIKSSSTWRWRKMCCVPYVVIFEITFVCLLVGICALTFFLIHVNTTDNKSYIYVEKITLHIILITTALFLGIAAVANLYTWTRMVGALFFSQRRHLQRTIAKLDTLKSEGFLQAVKHEVNLMKDMVKCIDSLNAQQTRLVIIVDGLDSCEQDKVLLVLDAVHMLFSDVNSPFIVILAIDPHVIAKAVELNSRRLFSESNIGGHNYLNNMVHLPFYLQNSGLRKVKIAQQTAQTYRKLANSNWTDNEESLNLGGSSVLGRSLSNRRLSSESALMSSTEKLKFPPRKGSRKLKVSESIASSIGSNLNRIGGAQDLTKMLLTDDYFSDVNPRSMRRLMNVVYITGRLLKAFQIDFNWYRLASWINITEQWPFRTSWIIYHYDLFEDSLEDGNSLKALYDKIRPHIPTIKDTEPLLELDRDERKFDIFLTFHRSSLLVSDLKIFLPFTINLDPYLKKVIKEETQVEDDGLMMGGPMRNVNIVPPTPVVGNMPQSWINNQPNWMLPKPGPNRRIKPFTGQSSSATSSMMFQRNMPWAQPWGDPVTMGPVPPMHYPVGPITALSADVLESKLSTLNVDGICKLLNKIDDLNAAALCDYKSVLQKNNINGRVLLHCDLDELKKLLQMSFGDWEMFRVLIVSLREHEMTSVMNQDDGRSFRGMKPSKASSERKGNGPKSGSSNEKDCSKTDGTMSGSRSKQSIMEKQVTLEEQMICGALQTLNEEACEDVLEETIETEIPLTSVIPPSPESVQESSIVCRSRTNSSSGVGETDFVVLQSSPVGHLHWQPISISIHGTEESLSDTNSSRCDSQPPSPVAERRRTNSIKLSTLKNNLEPGSGESIKKTKHVVINTENYVKMPERMRPTSLHISKNESRSSYLIRSRSKSIDTAPKKSAESKAIGFDKLHKLKEKLLYSSPELKDESDNESTPLVSEVSTPVQSPEHKKEFSSQSSTSLLSLSSPKSAMKRRRGSHNSTDLSDFSPSLSTHADLIGNTPLCDDDCLLSPDKPRARSRTMSECEDCSLSYILKANSRITASNISLYSKASHSSGQLSRQDAVDSDENVADVYCDPETRV